MAKGSSVGNKTSDFSQILCHCFIWLGQVCENTQNAFYLLQGGSDINQLYVVLQTLGTPTEASWPGLSKLPDYKKITFPESKPVPLDKVNFLFLKLTHARDS